MGAVVSDNAGRKRRYKEGPKNGTTDTGNSQRPLSNLQTKQCVKGKKITNGNSFVKQNAVELTIFWRSCHCKPKTEQKQRVGRNLDS